MLQRYVRSVITSISAHRQASRYSSITGTTTKSLRRLEKTFRDSILNKLKAGMIGGGEVKHEQLYEQFQGIHSEVDSLWINANKQYWTLYKSFEPLVPSPKPKRAVREMGPKGQNQDSPPQTVFTTDTSFPMLSSDTIRDILSVEISGLSG